MSGYLADIFSAPNSVVVVDGYLERLAPDVGSFHRRVDKCLVPLWLQSSRHCLCPSLAFLAKQPHTTEATGNYY